MGHVFVSYAREDYETAQKFARVLEGAGWPVWWDRTILAGERWEEQIREALDNASCVVVLWSKNSLISDFVRDEAAEAKQRNILVPALIDRVKIPLGFGAIQTEDLVDWEGGSSHEGVQRLLSAVAATLEREVSPAQRGEIGPPREDQASPPPPGDVDSPPPALAEPPQPPAEPPAEETAPPPLDWKQPTEIAPQGELPDDPLAARLQEALGPGVSIRGKLGQGRSCVVYLAEQTDPERQIAVKILRPKLLQDAKTVARFKREAWAMAGCPHPGIVPVHSLSHTSGDVPFLIMEFIEGETLEDLLNREGKLALSETVRIVAQVADALAYAHEHGLVHRDVKPADILLEKDTTRAVITDFGLSRLISKKERFPTLTGEGEVIGTPRYLSPEQANQGRTGPASDQYSLAVVAYEMLAGRGPFLGPRPGDYLRQHAEDTAPSLLELEPRLPPAVAGVIDRALQKEPSARFPSVREFAEALRATQVAAAEPPARKHPWPRRLVTTKAGLSVILAFVFLFNWGETELETTLNEEYGVSEWLRRQNAYAMRWLEGDFSFEYHDLTNRVAVLGYSTSYFFLFPLLVVGLGLALAYRREVSPFRVFSLSLAIDYALSLPFFIFFPVPERWAHSESGAMLLSDQWDTRLIETIRPISGLDNCFPSFHTSMTVIVILLCYMYGTRFRTSILALGLTIILSTLVLGVHWLADVIAGVAVGVLSVYLARWADRELSKPQLREAHAHA